MQPLSRWLAHSPMTEPGRHASYLTSLPSNVTLLNQVVHGLLIHCQWLDKYNDDVAVLGRSTLPVNERLIALLTCDERTLADVRIPAQRGVGTCRDFALMLCAFLRATGTAARLRCGFASYFGEAWEDHWVCEYWNSVDEKWCLSDAQLDTVIREACGVTFDPSDGPRDAFLTAGAAWLRCRTGRGDPEQFGQGDTRGLWFMKVNVVRDAFAVNGQETSSWDRWREAPPALRTVAPSEVGALDRIARHPEDAVDLTPSWLNDAA